MMIRNKEGFITGIAAAFVAIGAASYADPVFVPKGTDIPLVFDQSVSSKYAKVGDTIKLHVVRDVMVGDQMIIRRGTPVTGIISSVEHRKNFGVNAKLKLLFDPVKSTFGNRIDLGPKSKGKWSGSRTDEAAVISGGSALLLGPVGLVGGYFVVGKQVNVKPGDKIISEVIHDTSVGK